MLCALLIEFRRSRLYKINNKFDLEIFNPKVSLGPSGGDDHQQDSLTFSLKDIS